MSDSEQAPAQPAALLGLALASLRDAAFLTDERGRFLYVNEAGCRRLGYTAAELSALRTVDVDADLSEERWAALVSEIKREGSRPFPGRARTRDGKLFPIEISASYFESEGRGYTIALVRDVSERLAADESLRESQALFEAAFRASPFGLSLVRQSDRRFVDINDTSLAMFGYTREETLGKTAQDIDLYAVPEERAAMLAELQRDGGVHGFECKLRRKDGQVRPFLVSPRAVTVRGAGHLLFLSEDISERRRHEEEKALLEERLRQVQKMEAIGRLAGGVAHDFNNMLSVILANAESALERVSSADPIHEDLEEIRGAARRSADLTRQLLAFARKQTVAPKVLDLNETVAGMLSMLQRLVGENIQIRWRPQVGLGPVKMDPSQVDQILANLCVNARDAIHDVGKITIATSLRSVDAAGSGDEATGAPRDYAVLTITDDGRGMAPETLSHLFEPFFTTKEVGEGTGLGLATVYGIVQQNGGVIEVQSAPGTGTQFAISLPLFLGKSEAPRAQAQVAAPAQGQGTILLVEDELAILRITRRLLERLGYTVLAAATPGEALRLAEQHRGEIQLLMTDVIMPETNGWELAQRVGVLCPGVKRLFMSGHTADVIAHHGVLQEGVGFLQKPFQSERLAAKVRKVLASK